MTRRYPERPVVGIGAIVWRDGQVLLVRRGRPPRQGVWSIPGGGQEVGETVFEAAVREVREEAGLTVIPQGIVTVVDSITRDAEGRAEYHYTLVEVAALWQAGEAVAGDDADAVRWVRLDELDGIVEWSETRRVIRLAAAQMGWA